MYINPQLLDLTIEQVLNRINTTPCNGQLTSDLKAKAAKLGYTLEGYYLPDVWGAHWRYRILNKTI
jgi:hypothetical protein